MVLIIDNYDSFVYNLAQYVGELGKEPLVRRNDHVTLDEIASLAPSHIIISPGPKTPREAGVSNEVIQIFAGKTPVLGVCLGHQCIGEVFGGRIVGAELPMHGKTSVVRHDFHGVFEGLPDPISVGRYHSLVIDPGLLPDCLVVTARTEDGVIMGVRHREFAVEGVQFHPESILTDQGRAIMRNFLSMSAAVLA
jgi:anthranilate synthase/aminodeoxychorismate synthase-like glutamine amidotransferase